MAVRALGWFGLLGVLLPLSVASAAQVPPPVAERPWLVMSLAGLDRVLDSLDTLLDTADRPELSELLARRYAALGDFAGIDRTRPLGLMRTWRVDDPATPETEQPADVLFLPVADRAAFLKTITFGQVDYRLVAADHAEIDRPGEPYHVLFHDGYAWLGDDVRQLSAFAQRREQILRPMPRTADVALLLSLDQIPPADRARLITPWQRATEPWLQQRDQESPKGYAWRRSLSEGLLSSATRIAGDARQLLITQTLNADGRTSDWALSLRLPGGPSVWAARPTPLARLDDPAAVSSGVLQWQPEGTARGEAPDRCELAWLLYGQPFAQREAVAVLQAPGLAAWVAEWPVTGPAELALGNGVLRRITLPATPIWLRHFIGWDPEAWVGVIDDRLWIGFGPPDSVRPHLEQAHARLVPADGDQPQKVALRLRLSARDLVQLQSGFDSGWAYQQLVKGGDQIRLTVESPPQMLTVRATVDVGVLRLLGALLAHELSLELDQLLATPAD
jgi:hypothetical protein